MANETLSRWTTPLRVLVIILAGFLVYYPALNGMWLWDDTLYVTGNPLLRDSGRLWAAWFVPGSFIEYYPIEQTVQWAQWKLWGEETFGYHLTNVILHSIGALLVWRLLVKFQLRWAWLGGLIFVLHPMNVESVAYLSELKNTLSLPPFLLAAGFFIDFEASCRPRDYLLALAFFLVAMLCKISVMSFPFAMLLYVWWKHGRVGWKDLGRVVPFLVISFVLGAVTLWAGQHFEQRYPSHPAALPADDLVSRLPLVGWIFSAYFAHFFWPVLPLPMYPRWSPSPFAPLTFLPLVLWGGALYLLSRMRAEWARNILLGLGFFAIMLLPFCGLVIISYMNFSWIMDHFLYVPMIGLIGLTVAGLERVHSVLPSLLRWLYLGILSGILLVLAARSQDYAAVWTDRATLWTYTVANNPSAWMAHYNLGNDLRLRNQYDLAIEEYQESIRLNPDYDWAHNNLGMALTNFPERLPEAVSEFREAVRLRPTSVEARNNLANALLQLPDHDTEAINEYREALRLQPDSLEARYNLGLALAKLPGHEQEARTEFEEILRVHPGYEPAQKMLKQL